MRQVELRVFARHTGPVLCADILSRDVISVDVGMGAGYAWTLPGRHKLRALVADVMTLDVQVAHPDQSIGELVSLLSDQGLHHLPVLDAQRHVVGMISQSDPIAALLRASIDSATRAIAA